MRNRERTFAEVMELVSQPTGQFQPEIFVEHLSAPMLLVLSGIERHVHEINDRDQELIDSALAELAYRQLLDYGTRG